MDITSKLLVSYKSIDNYNRINNLRGQNLLLRNFQVIGELYLIYLLERNGLLPNSDNFQKKYDKALNYFKDIFLNHTSKNYERFYQELMEIFNIDDFSKVVDPFGKLYQQIISSTKKQNRGIVFTPLPIVDYILDQLGFPASINKDKPSKLIDLACGSGLFLSRATSKICSSGKKSQLKPLDILKLTKKSIFGFDIDPVAVLLSKINIVSELLINLKESFPLEEPLILNVYKTNSIVRNSTSDSLIIRKLKSERYDFVVGNPPYIESKKMDDKTKKICKENFPDDAKRHYDIYALFLVLGVNLLKETGQLGFIIPNKFLISKFARPFRERFLEERLISQILDLAHQKVFQPAVYPIILLLNKQRRSDERIMMLSDVKLDELSQFDLNQKSEYVTPSFFQQTVNKTIFFPKNNAFSLLERIFLKSKLSLGDVIRFRWAISFHRKGLREQFVSRKPKGKKPLKFLGGKSYGGNREVERYSVKWNGYWIDYDQEKAKKLRNNFQDLKYSLQKKIIVCQHALRMRATIDIQGYVCKDIFLLGHLRDIAKQENLSLEFMLGLLNSKLFSFMYNIMFSGSEIMGKYLHYLPTFLHDLPILIPSEENQRLIEKYVNDLLEHYDDEIDSKIDEIVYKMYDCTDEEISSIEVHISNYLMK
jgi:type I restriction-modification system DNA methylase subunit